MNTKERVLCAAIKYSLQKMTGDEKLTVVASGGKLVARTSADLKEAQEHLANLKSALNEKDRFSVDYDDAEPKHGEKTGKPLSEEELNFVRNVYGQILPQGYSLNEKDNYWYRLGYTEELDTPMQVNYVLDDLKELVGEDKLVLKYMAR